MNKLSFLILVALIYLSMAENTLKPNPEEPIKYSSLAPSTSTVKPNQGTKLNETFKKIVDEMKKVDTGIKGWSNLTAGSCQKVIWGYKHYRCTAYIPKADQSKGWLLMLKIDVNLNSGNVKLYNVEKGALEGEKVENEKLVPVTYDIWSQVKHNILENTHVKCQIHWGDQPNNCDLSINI